MASYIATAKFPTSNFSFNSNSTSFPSFPIPISISVPNHNPRPPLLLRLSAAKSQTGPVKKKSSSSSNKKKKKSNNAGGGFGKKNLKEVGYDEIEKSDDASFPESLPPLPKPPAGFVVDDSGRVLMASSKRTVTIVDSASNSPLECIIRRVFTSSKGEECMLVFPLDMPILIIQNTADGWTAVSDDEVDAILPTVDYELAKAQMHFIKSGFCYTARGGICYTEDDIFDVRSDDGQDLDGLPTQGIEITCFQLDGTQYMIYTPADPLLFVVVKDQNGVVQVANDDILEDPTILSAIDEETEFNALVEEEAALLESLLLDDES